MSHANARLTAHGRLLLVTRIEEQGRPVAHVAAELGVSRATGYKWWARWRAEGLPGLLDRPSRPRSCPRRTAAEVETAICALRRDRKLGPRRIAASSGWPPAPSTRSCAATACTGWTASTGPARRRSAATSGPGPVSWCTLT